MTAAPVIDEREHADVVKAVVNAKLGSSPARCYDYDEVPGSERNPHEDERKKPLPRLYIAMSLERRYVPPARLSGRSSRSGWRLSLRAVGATVDECRWALLRATEALDDVRLTVDGETSTPVKHEASTAPEWDDKRYSALVQFTYAL